MNLLRLTTVTLTVALLFACAKPAPTEPWQEAGGREDLHLRMAKWHIDSGMSDPALAVLRELRETYHSKRPEIGLLQGRALHLQGAYASAKELLVSAVSAMPRSAEAHRALGVLLADMGDTTGAMASLHTAATLDPMSSATWNNLGFLQTVSGECPSGRESLSRALEVDSTSNRIRNNLAMSMACLGDREGALSLLRTTEPEAIARYDLGTYLERFGRASEACEQFDIAAFADPTDERARDAASRLRQDGLCPATSQRTP
jgi:thioredoxin-like negative regulator of GroEL